MRRDNSAPSSPAMRGQARRRSDQFSEKLQNLVQNSPQTPPSPFERRHSVGGGDRKPDVPRLKLSTSPASTPTRRASVGSEQLAPQHAGVKAGRRASDTGPQRRRASETGAGMQMSGDEYLKHLRALANREQGTDDLNSDAPSDASNSSVSRDLMRIEATQTERTQNATGDRPKEKRNSRVSFSFSEDDGKASLSMPDSLLVAKELEQRIETFTEDDALERKRLQVALELEQKEHSKLENDLARVESNAEDYSEFCSQETQELNTELLTLKQQLEKQTEDFGVEMRAKEEENRQRMSDLHEALEQGKKDRELAAAQEESSSSLKSQLEEAAEVHVHLEEQIAAGKLTATASSKRSSTSKLMEDTPCVEQIGNVKILTQKAVEFLTALRDQIPADAQVHCDRALEVLQNVQLQSLDLAHQVEDVLGAERQRAEAAEDVAKEFHELLEAENAENAELTEKVNALEQQLLEQAKLHKESPSKMEREQGIGNIVSLEPQLQEQARLHEGSMKKAEALEQQLQEKVNILERQEQDLGILEEQAKFHRQTVEFLEETRQRSMQQSEKEIKSLELAQQTLSSALAEEESFVKRQGREQQEEIHALKLTEHYSGHHAEEIRVHQEKNQSLQDMINSPVINQYVGRLVNRVTQIYEPLEQVQDHNKEMQAVEWTHEHARDSAQLRKKLDDKVNECDKLRGHCQFLERHTEETDAAHQQEIQKLEQEGHRMVRSLQDALSQEKKIIESLKRGSISQLSEAQLEAQSHAQQQELRRLEIADLSQTAKLKALEQDMEEFNLLCTHEESISAKLLEEVMERDHHCEKLQASLSSFEQKLEQSVQMQKDGIKPVEFAVTKLRDDADYWRRVSKANEKGMQKLRETNAALTIQSHWRIQQVRNEGGRLLSKPDSFQVSPLPPPPAPSEAARRHTVVDQAQETFRIFMEEKRALKQQIKEHKEAVDKAKLSMEAHHALAEQRSEENMAIKQEIEASQEALKALEHWKQKAESSHAALEQHTALRDQRSAENIEASQAALENLKQKAEDSHAALEQNSASADQRSQENTVLKQEVQASHKVLMELEDKSNADITALKHWEKNLEESDAALHHAQEVISHMVLPVIYWKACCSSKTGASRQVLMQARFDDMRQTRNHTHEESKELQHKNVELLHKNLPSRTQEQEEQVIRNLQLELRSQASNHEQAQELHELHLLEAHDRLDHEEKLVCTFRLESEVQESKFRMSQHSQEHQLAELAQSLEHMRAARDGTEREVSSLRLVVEQCEGKIQQSETNQQKFKKGEEDVRLECIASYVRSLSKKGEEDAITRLRRQGEKAEEETEELLRIASYVRSLSQKGEEDAITRLQRQGEKAEEENDNDLQLAIEVKDKIYEMECNLLSSLESDDQEHLAGQGLLALQEFNQEAEAGLLKEEVDLSKAAYHELKRQMKIDQNEANDMERDLQTSLKTQEEAVRCLNLELEWESRACVLLEERALSAEGSSEIPVNNVALNNRRDLAAATIQQVWRLRGAAKEIAIISGMSDELKKEMSQLRRTCEALTTEKKLAQKIVIPEGESNLATLRELEELLEEQSRNQMERLDSLKYHLDLVNKSRASSNAIKSRWDEECGVLQRQVSASLQALAEAQWQLHRVTQESFQLRKEVDRLKKAQDESLAENKSLEQQIISHRTFVKHMLNNPAMASEVQRGVAQGVDAFASLSVQPAGGSREASSGRGSPELLQYKRRSPFQHTQIAATYGMPGIESGNVVRSPMRQKSSAQQTMNRVNSDPSFRVTRQPAQNLRWGV